MFIYKFVLIVYTYGTLLKNNVKECLVNLSGRLNLFQFKLVIYKDMNFINMFLCRISIFLKNRITNKNINCIRNQIEHIWSWGLIDIVDYVLLTRRSLIPQWEGRNTIEDKDHNYKPRVTKTAMRERINLWGLRPILVIFSSLQCNIFFG